MYKITFDLPNLAKGAEFDVGGLGRFKNGSEYVIDDETAEGFRAYHSRFETVEDGNTVDVVNNEGDTVQEPHYEFVNGPTVLQALESVPGVTVEVHKEETAEEKKARLKAEREQKKHDEEEAAKAAEGNQGGDN
jgi:hypothetical protein